MRGCPRPSRLMVVTALLLAAVGRQGAGAAPDELTVAGSEAFAPCLAPALDAFSRESGVVTRLEVRDPDPPGDADVVVGDDSELTRLLESGDTTPDAFDLGYLPWVLVAPQGSGADVWAAERGPAVEVLGGKVSREAREALGLPSHRVRLLRDREKLRQAPYALVPRSLAGPGTWREVDVRPLVATVAIVSSTPRGGDARRLLAFLKGPQGREALSSCFAAVGERATTAETAATYATAVVDWWLPPCSLDRNGYNDPEEVLGAPDAQRLPGQQQFSGIMSLGQGGYVTVDLGRSIQNGPGPDVRVFQMVSGEWVTLYAATAAQGPFRLVGLRRPCGERTPGVFSNHCDFDLAAAGLSETRYLKVEDGEIYPCLAGGTITEGADIDAVQALNP